MKRLLLLLLAVAWTGSLNAQQGEPVQVARLSLEQARDGQTEILKRYPLHQTETKALIEAHVLLGFSFEVDRKTSPVTVFDEGPKQ